MSVGAMVFHTTFNNISVILVLLLEETNISVIFWRSVLLLEETGVPGDGKMAQCVKS
jgi:hypothetical protein